MSDDPESDPFDGIPDDPPTTAQEVARVPTRYDIKDRSGVLVAVHLREDLPTGKRVWWESPNGTPGLAGAPLAGLPLYGIERLEGLWVVVTEGEKAADALIASGIPAVGTVTGAASAPGPDALAELSGLTVVLWPDHDAVGRQHMVRVAEGLEGIAGSVSWVLVPAGAEKGWDAADADHATRVVLAEAGAMRAQVDAVFRDDRARRLVRTEHEVAMSMAEEREGLCNWLGSMLHRPPLERPSVAYRPMRALVEALWWDLSDRTPDPAEPLHLSPRIVDEHPWGEGADA